MFLSLHHKLKIHNSWWTNYSRAYIFARLDLALSAGQPADELPEVTHLCADVAGGALADSGDVVARGRVVAGAAPTAVLAPGTARTPVTAHVALGARGPG